MGVRYKENGRSIEEGFDCYGAGIEVCKRFGYSVPDLDEAKNTERDFMACLLKGVSLAKVKEVPYPEKEADVIFFRNFEGATDHMGIYLGDDLFCHCNKHGFHVERLGIRKRFIGRCYTWLE